MSWCNISFQKQRLFLGSVLNSENCRKSSVSFWGVFVFIFFLGGCSLLQTKPKVVTLETPLRLEMKSVMGREEIMRHHFDSFTESHESNQIRNQKDETVDFTTQTIAKNVGPDKSVTYEVKVIKKDGPVELHDLAYPEPGEVLEMIIGPTAQVFKAGDYPEQSVFFIPPISIPYDLVKKGDTWEMEHDWVSDSSGLPLTLDLVSILKEFYSCGNSDTCAEIEISGEVFMAKGTLQSGTFKSTMTGRLLFAVNAGMVVWADMRSQENLKGPESSVAVQSCLVSELESPKEYHWPSIKDPMCQPKESLGPSLPGFGSQ